MRPIPDRSSEPFDPTHPDYDPSEGDFEAVMPSRDMLAIIASRSGQPPAVVQKIVEELFTEIRDAVARGSKVSIPGWISFEHVDSAARTGRNPQTGAEIQIPAGKRVKVTAGSKLKAAAK